MNAQRSDPGAGGVAKAPHSLPLFAELERAGAPQGVNEAAEPSANRGAPTQRREKQGREKQRREKQSREKQSREKQSREKQSREKRDRHLVAARRLARMVRRLPEHSVEQTRAGQAICRHLIALLKEAELDKTER